MDQHILLIEDEAKIARVVTLELQHEGYLVTHAEDGQKGIELALGADWDLILLDIMLPELSGMDVLRRFRRVNRRVPVILLTARDAVPDKVEGLDLGANDYLTKPFAMEELLARIRNHLRMAELQTQGDADPHNEIYSIDNLSLDPKTRIVQREGKSIDLTPREFDLLQFLLENKETVLSREQILSEVWGFDFIGDTNLVDVYIRYLRQKIDKGFKHNLIQTSRGIGYYVTEPTT